MQFGNRHTNIKLGDPFAEIDDINYQVRIYAQAVRDLAAELGVPLFDTFALFESREGGFDLIGDGCHPYVEGHQLIADGMLSLVDEPPHAPGPNVIAGSRPVVPPTAPSVHIVFTRIRNAGFSSKTPGIRVPQCAHCPASAIDHSVS